MASGPALERRYGVAAKNLTGHAAEEAAGIVAYYLACGVRGLIYALAPERIIVGGGLTNLPGLYERARAELKGQLNGYPGLLEHAANDFLVPAREDAGIAGAFVLAQRAAGRPATATA
jgi:fructokinase